MNCPDVRTRFLELERGQLAPELRGEIEDHLRACAACARSREVEHVVSGLLERRLPRYPASPELKRRVAQLVAPAATPVIAAALAAAWSAIVQSAARMRWARVVAPTLALGIVAGVLVQRVATREEGVLTSVTAEAVNDHLRTLVSTRPLDVESGAHHHVKPWFAGKLDFAPAVPAPSGQDLRLEGGAVGYFLDRKAALVRYGLREHALTMIVFPAQGLPWPPRGATRLPAFEAFLGSERGFHAVFWRSGELCYALVSDVDPGELGAVAAQLARSS